jgi:hypothetical protein
LISAERRDEELLEMEDMVVDTSQSHLVLNPLTIQIPPDGIPLLDNQNSIERSPLLDLQNYFAEDTLNGEQSHLATYSGSSQQQSHPAANSGGVAQSHLATNGQQTHLTAN